MTTKRPNKRYKGGVITQHRWRENNEWEEHKIKLQEGRERYQSRVRKALKVYAYLEERDLLPDIE